MSNITILAGVPGCGKSTYARRLSSPCVRIVSSDQIRKQMAGSLLAAHQQKVNPWPQFHRDIENSAIHGVNVIADATFLTHKSRKTVRDIAQKHNTDFHLVLFKNVAEALDRNKLRDPDEIVPDEVQDNMVKQYWDTLAILPQEWYTSRTYIERLL